MQVSEVEVFTTTLVAESFTLPAGARTIDLNNIGGGDATILGNGTKGGKVSSAVTLSSGLAYSFGDVNKPYPEIVIDATATQVELIANY